MQTPAQARLAVLSRQLTTVRARMGGEAIGDEARTRWACSAPGAHVALSGLAGTRIERPGTLGGGLAGPCARQAV
jgi:hypothetical protein